MKSILIHAWTLYEVNGEYYIPYTHWIYLREIVKEYDRIHLLSPIKKLDHNTQGFKEIHSFKEVFVYKLPPNNGYIHSIRHFFKYLKAYKSLSHECDVAYARYPIPFGWLQRIYFKERNNIIHFVGDPIETIKYNPNISRLKKILYLAFFLPEHCMFLFACKKARVFTNGFKIADKLAKIDIKAIPLISSTLTEEDFYFKNKVIDPNQPRLIYLGYLRKAKGIDTLIKSFQIIQKQKPLSILTIIGHGEMETEVKEYVTNNQIKNIVFLGHIDDREQLNHLLRQHDIFCFSSLSEGSPRVVLEAMANGLAVVSTPVGSLPQIFKNQHDILFTKFNDEMSLANEILCLAQDNDFYNSVRRNSFEKVKNLTLEKFIKSIFNGK